MSIVGHLRARVTLLGVSFGVVNGRVGKQRQIQHVQPDYGSVAFVAVIMPMPRRCDDNITPHEGHFLAFHGSETFSFNNEAASICDMAVGGCSLPWFDDLETAVDGICGMGGL